MLFRPPPSTASTRSSPTVCGISASRAGCSVLVSCNSNFFNCSAWRRRWLAVQYNGRGHSPAVLMARIRDEDTGIETVLEPNHLVGRSEHCTTRLPDSYVSAEHASIRWDGKDWIVKDLGSKNGTFVDDAQVGPASGVAVQPGSRIAFSNQSRVWKLIDAEAPSTMAIP